MKLVGIDYGTKNVGIAAGDTEHGMAFPRVVLPNTKDLIEQVRKICLEEMAEKVILGESKNFKGQDNVVMKEIREFKESLEKVLQIPVLLEPEFMTSAEAEHLQGKNSMLDASAAALILKSYLDKKHD